ncbi:MAG: adenylate/guanylate cyclase domain-containing protein, partial [Dehalococcoidia bacterium]|nr:adenylate/guanylate cyclase domain-containing protein [Dehalococcoidia bacterium]
MKCPQCQFENPESMQFCGKCGAKLEKTCPQCNSSSPPEYKFCGKCGHALAQTEVVTYVDYTEPQSYIPKSLADKIIDSRSSIEGERKLVTVLFADVANYTSISEKLDPEEVYQIMDGCYQVLMDEIHKYEGTIDKFTGDGVMALFGAPVSHENHAQRACYSALAMQKSIGEYGERIEKECGVEFKMRVGLNSGPVIVSSVGNDLRMDYTAIGDTVNLASRMETNAKPGIVLVSANTYKIARDFFKFEPMGKIQVKGKEEPVEAYQIIEAGEVETRIEASVARGLTKFAGRQREIAALKEAFGKARTGSGQVVGIVGEAGVGKSRLILELKEVIPIDEYTCLEGQCLHYGGLMAYLPLMDILRTYFDINEGEREFIVKKKMVDKITLLDVNLENILPSLHDILSLNVEDANYIILEPQQKRERIFEAIRDLLIRESQNRPLIIAIDDLQWIDRTSEEFLTYLIGWLTNARILLIILYRPEYTHQWASKSYYSQIRVEQLSTDNSADLVKSILEDGEVVPELSDLIFTRAAGNPLFMEEFTHTLVENGSIQKKDHKYVLSTKASEIQVPDTIQGIIAARMDRLEDNLKRTMQVASVIGRDFAFRILQTITGMSEELKSCLLNLQGLEFIYEKNLFPELEYIFKHALTQQVAYNSLLLKKRKELHESIGTAIEELYPDRLEEFYEMLAHHYARTENREKAYEYLKLSGDKTSGHYANREAFYFYREALNILKKMPQNEENRKKEIEILLLMESPMKLLAYPEDSLQILEEGELLAKEFGDLRSLAILYSNIGLCHTFKGDSKQGIRYAEYCFDMAAKIEDIEIMAPTAFNLCSSYAILGELVKTVEIAPKVLSLLEKTHRESESFGVALNFNIYAALCSYCGQAMGFMGDFKEGVALCEKGLRFVQYMDNLYSLGFVEITYGLLYIARGDGENAINHLQKAVAYGEQGQIIPVMSLASGLLGWGYRLVKNPETARQYIEKGLQIQEDTGLSMLMSLNKVALSMVHFDLGDLESARKCAEEALELARSNDEKWALGVAWIFLGMVLGKVDESQYSNAEECILQGIKHCNKWKMKPLCSEGYLYLGELYAAMDQSEKALENLKKAEAAFQAMGMDYWLRRTQEVLERVQA